jgi:ABC-2 type transport system ATP-binding protein
MNSHCLAELSGVSKRFGKILALDGLDLQVCRDELLAVLGPNGAGKSTAISLLLGLQRPDSGTVELFGQSPERLEARRQIGVMMQEVSLAPELRVREQIALVASYYPAPLTPDAVIATTRTAPLADRLTGNSRADRSARHNLRWPFVAVPSCSFLTNLQWDWMCRPAN